MTQTYENNEGKKLTTLENQERLFQRHLELFKIRKGQTLDELLKQANNPRRYAKNKHY